MGCSIGELVASRQESHAFRQSFAQARSRDDLGLHTIMHSVTGRADARMKTDATVQCGDESSEARHRRVRSEVLVGFRSREQRETKVALATSVPQGLGVAVQKHDSTLLLHLPEHVQIGALS
jgi:hypothetical protein